MDQNILLKYQHQRVPRYTSYPTAPQFTPAVGEAAQRAWLAALPPDTSLSLYIHIPFCSIRCWYCGCHTAVVNRPEPVDRYVGTLRREIASVADALPDRMPVGHVHWGGGTPSTSGTLATLRPRPAR